MFAKIEKNKIVELRAIKEGKGWVPVPEEVAGETKIYDKETKSVRAMTRDEEIAEFQSFLVPDAWDHLRQRREAYLYDTDKMVVADRPPTEHMEEYRIYLRDIPDSYTDETIMNQAPVMTFDEYVASLSAPSSDEDLLDVEAE